MLPIRRKGERGPWLVMLHWLGGGAQTWDEVSDALGARGVRCAALDLPGFGEAHGVDGHDVSTMADEVIETVRRLRASGEPWLLAGLSMGGKVAAVVARRALDGEPGLDGLRGLVLVSASPPGPEPMSDSKRADMLRTLGTDPGDPARARQHAADFVDANTGKLPLLDHVRERAIAGVLAQNRTAFRDWLDHGSKEDWSSRVGALALPALVIAGTEDEELGVDAQRAHTLPHVPGGELVIFEATGHLSPLERAGELVEHVTQFFGRTGLPLTTAEAAPGRAFTSLLASAHTAPQTRRVLEERLARSLDWTTAPRVFRPDELRTLRALAARIVPGAGIDLAGRLDAQLAAGPGDGWRFATLPPDVAAWRQGLASLDLAARRTHGVSFLALHDAQKDGLLRQAAAGSLGRGLLGAMHLGEAADAFPAAEMRSWFEDVRAEFTRLYVADPRTLDRLRFTGFADDLGFTRIAIGQREEFER